MLMNRSDPRETASSMPPPLTQMATTKSEVSQMTAVAAYCQCCRDSRRRAGGRPVLDCGAPCRRMSPDVGGAALRGVASVVVGFMGLSL
ncbi:hypothetical protein AXH35_08755 [Acidipropionibacterium acidipropionici]|uniref:Uncharacterized protein n=1 Tax=Acidipropionibacterium acidipropionici TaxID=1748 RepID=A0AAC8YFJ7_9ACTN|nr:hypothetical protein AXH35_08755 [Acidipropionibacterium acidipropionici]